MRQLCYISNMIDMADDPDVRAVASLVLRLDSKSGVPTYLQIVQQVEHAMRLGYLIEGDQLPRVKDVVASLSINPNTVLKAYRDLEQKGFVVALPGQGTFIKVSPESLELSVLESLRASLTNGWLREAREAGLAVQDINALFSTVLQESEQGSDETNVSRKKSGGSAA
jgi:GntR family transcriptional regulator